MVTKVIHASARTACRFFSAEPWQECFNSELFNVAQHSLFTPFDDKGRKYQNDGHTQRKGRRVEGHRQTARHFAQRSIELFRSDVGNRHRNSDDSTQKSENRNRPRDSANRCEGLVQAITGQFGKVAKVLFQPFAP